MLAKIDAKLTDRWIDCEDKKSHKIFVDDLLPENEVNFEVSRFLGNEYPKSLESVSYEPVSYLPSDSFLQLGMFAKNDITKGSIIEGVVGVLAEIRDDEVIAGLNDVSILCSRLRDMQWLMLGPISFVNASCKSNIEYRQIKDISMGQELTVFYYRHFFGMFNVDCLCPHKSEHGDPFPTAPKAAKKRKLIGPQEAVGTPPRVNVTILNLETPLRKIFIERLPTRRALYDLSNSSSNNKDDCEEQYISYDSVFGEIDAVLSPVKMSTPLNSQQFALSMSPVEPNDDQTDEPLLEPTDIVCSTPVCLQDFETEEIENTRDNVEPFALFQEDGTPLFSGASSTTESFLKEFDGICDKHKLSKKSRQDFLKLFSKALPVPNNLFSKLAVLFCRILLEKFLGMLSFVQWTLGLRWKKFWLKIPLR